MLVASLVIVGVVAGVFLTAGAVAAFVRFVSKSTKASLAIGTLVMPLLICASLAYWVKTMEVSDPAPGNVLIGNLILLSVVTPTAFVASRLMNGLLTRRALRRGR